MVDAKRARTAETPKLPSLHLRSRAPVLYPPVGASCISASPTRPKPSQHVGSEFHVQTQQWEYEAGRIKDTGRVIEPRNQTWWTRGYPSGRREGKADGLPGLEGNSPGYALASRGDSTGVCERGMYLQG